MAISSRLTTNGESLIVLLKSPGSCGVADCRFDHVFNLQVLVKEKASVLNTEALLFFGSSTWARTRDLRINRKQLDKTMLVLWALQARN